MELLAPICMAQGLLAPICMTQGPLAPDCTAQGLQTPNCAAQSYFRADPSRIDSQLPVLHLIAQDALALGTGVRQRGNGLMGFVRCGGSDLLLIVK